MVTHAEAALTGRRVTVEMDPDKSWIRFTRDATVVRPLAAPGGSLVLLRLSKPLWYWHVVFRRAKFLGVRIEGPYYMIREGKSVAVESRSYGEVYAIKAANPEKPHRRWPRLELRLQPRNLVQLGMATLRFV